MSTVVFIGSMFPYGHPDYDGYRSISKFLEIESKISTGAWVVVGDSLLDGFSARKQESTGLHAFGSGMEEAREYRSLHKDPAFGLALSKMPRNVPIVTVALGDSIPWFTGAGLDGLVISGSGTGSIPDGVLEKVKKEMGGRPVVVSTRCMHGPNHADDLYPGSVDRYERNGFIVRRYSELNPLQARIKLALEIADGRFN